jgi:hypothetical protein
MAKIVQPIPAFPVSRYEADSLHQLSDFVRIALAATINQRSSHDSETTEKENIMSNYLPPSLTDPDDYDEGFDEEEECDFSDAPDPLEDFDDDTEVGDDDYE